MEKHGENEQGNKRANEIKTFSVPFFLDRIQENIKITTKSASNLNKEEILNQALKFYSQGNILEAEKYYQNLIKQGFTDHIVFSNYGEILIHNGRLKEAEDNLRKAIKLNPYNANDHKNLGSVLIHYGQLNEAKIETEKALELKPDFDKAHVNLGLILRLYGQLEEAELSTRKSIEINPDFALAYSNLGGILEDLGKFEEAEISLRKAIELNPNNPDTYYNLGGVLRNLSQLKEAEVSLRKAIKLNPHFAQAHSNLGGILKDLGKLKEAEVSLNKAIELDSGLAEAHANLGAVLRDLGRFEEAALSTYKAIDQSPDFAVAYLNLGDISTSLGKLKEAEVSLLKAIQLKPDFADAYFNLSCIQLLKGNYQSGLKNYEFRFKKKKPTITHGNSNLKRIDQKKFKKGAELLVISEQGLGDTMQYMRYIPYLRTQGLNVSFCAQKKLHSLITASGIDANPLTPEQSTSVAEGEWIPLLSLMKYLKVSPENPIITEPYIYSTGELKKKWRNLLSKEKRPIVGINWQGNPEMEKNHQGRSLPLETFSGLFDLNEIMMLSLQKGFGSEQLENCSFKNKFVECQPVVNSSWDFLENAAIIENCDLIITSDTSIAHLAGGMGKKVWLLLKDIPYWTWGLEVESTFWYPSMRLFRQRERQNWNEVMERVSIELKNYIENLE